MDVPSIIFSDMVIAQDDWGDVVAVDVVTGELLWQQTMCPLPTGTLGAYTSVIAGNNGMVYATCSIFVYALNASNNGTVSWVTPLQGLYTFTLMQSPLLVDNSGILYVTAQHFGRYWLNATTGVVIWATGNADVTMAAAPVALTDNDVTSVVYGLGGSYAAVGFRILTGTDPTNNASIVPAPFPTSVTLSSITVTRHGSAILTASQYVAVGDDVMEFSFATASNITTGEQLWSINLTGLIVSGTYPDIDPRPILFEPTPNDDDSIAIIHEFSQGDLFALNATTGALLWYFNGSALLCSQLSATQPRHGARGSLRTAPHPAPERKTSALRNRMSVQDNQGATLTSHWSTLKDRSHSAPRLMADTDRSNDRLGSFNAAQRQSTVVDVDGVVYTAYQGCLYAVDARSGTLLWDYLYGPYSLGGLIISDANNGSLIVSSMHGLFALSRRASPAPAPATTPKLSAGAIAGAVIGSLAGAVLVAVAGVALWRRRRVKELLRLRQAEDADSESPLISATSVQ